jgi:hypothetical protein
MSSDDDLLPEFESDQRAEWRIREGDVIVLWYDRQTGSWAGERERPDPSTGGQLGPQPLSPQEALAVARAHDLRFRNGTKAT